MKLWYPSFDPVTNTMSSALVWIRLPNFPLHIWSLTSLRAIGNALGKFHYVDVFSIGQVLPHMLSVYHVEVICDASQEP